MEQTVAETASTEAMIRVVDLLHHYGLRPTLRDVNLEIRAGELVVIMGPNGSGKTTLLAVIAGLLWPAHGYVEIGGLRRRSSEEVELAIRKRVYYLPAEPWLPPNATGREFLVAVARVYDVPDLQAMDHTDRLLQLFELQQKGDTAIAHYSTGQTKKIALAGALISQASVLLLDEPFSGGLDPSGIQALKRVLKGLAERRDMTILMSSPVPELVEDLADRIALLKGGCVVAFDTAEGLRRLAGVDGVLAEVFERLVQAHTNEHIQQYFEGDES